MCAHVCVLVRVCDCGCVDVLAPRGMYVCSCVRVGACVCVNVGVWMCLRQELWMCAHVCVPVCM